jgi:hypothetical protein
MHTLRILIFLALVTLTSIAAASDHQYECFVRQMWQVEKNGTAYISSPSAGTYVGHTFKIDRHTGKIDSDFLPYSELEVIWQGSSKEPFVARTAIPKVDGKYADWPNVQFLKIEEFRETPLKPFILVDVIDVKAGECK